MHTFNNNPAGPPIKAWLERQNLTEAEAVALFVDRSSAVVVGQGRRPVVWQEASVNVCFFGTPFVLFLFCLKPWNSSNGCSQSQRKCLWAILVEKPRNTLLASCFQRIRRSSPLGVRLLLTNVPAAKNGLTGVWPPSFKVGDFKSADEHRSKTHPESRFQPQLTVAGAPSQSMVRTKGVGYQVGCPRSHSPVIFYPN
jgi:hypothetical protein